MHCMLYKIYSNTERGFINNHNYMVYFCHATIKKIMKVQYVTILIILCIFVCYNTCTIMYSFLCVVFIIHALIFCIFCFT